MLHAYDGRNRSRHRKCTTDTRELVSNHSISRCDRGGIMALIQLICGSSAGIKPRYGRPAATAQDWRRPVASVDRRSCCPSNPDLSVWRIRLGAGKAITAFADRTTGLIDIAGTDAPSHGFDPTRTRSGRRNRPHCSFRRTSRLHCAQCTRTGNLLPALKRTASHVASSASARQSTSWQVSKSAHRPSCSVPAPTGCGDLPPIRDG